MRRIVATITIALLLLLPGAANGTLWTFDTALSGSQEFPANASSGSGMAQVLLDTVSRLVDVTGTYSGLSSNAVAARLHGFAGPATNAPVIVPLTESGGTAGTFSGMGTLVDDISVQNMLSGLTYLNVTTGSFPGGEIRGQVVNPHIDRFWKFNVNLSGLQEFPANASSGTGLAQVLLDEVSREVDVTGTYSGLSSNAVAVYLHGFAGPSTNAPVIIPLMDSGGTSGTFSGSGTLADDMSVEKMLSGLTYLNVHSASFPGGEVRGQVINPLTIPEGDFNHNGLVDAADYVIWRKGVGTIFTQNDYNAWRSHFGQTAGSGSGATANPAVPEPTTLMLMSLAAAGGYLRRSRSA